MRGPRVSVAGLVGVAAVAAVGLAALAAPSEWWDAAVDSLATLLLLASVVGAAVGRRRAPWLGFAVFGWGYYVLGMVPDGSSGMQPRLLTRRALAWMYPAVHGPTASEYRCSSFADWRGGVMVQTAVPAGTTPEVDLVKRKPFLRAGDSPCGLATALLGGLVGLAFARRREGRRADDRPATAPGGPHP